MIEDVVFYMDVSGTDTTLSIKRSVSMPFIPRIGDTIAGETPENWGRHYSAKVEDVWYDLETMETAVFVDMEDNDHPTFTAKELVDDLVILGWELA